MEIEIKLPWPDWQVTKLLGAGGYGRVYEIHRDRYGISEVAAVKVLSFPNDEDEISEGLRSGYVEETLAAEYRQQVESVLKEYRLLKELGDDPHIVRCDDYDAVPHSNGIGWNVYLKMELLTPLKQYLGKNAIPPEQTVQLGSDICQALAACWAKRILHRDIKPDNILVSGKGVFKLSDFGEAKLVEKTMASGVAGTWSFVAPEVGNHSRYGEPADIYSLGMVLYWMLNRCMLPFLPRPWGLCSTAEQDQARQRRLSGEPLPPPADGSPALKKVVLKACAFRPEDRYATPDELRKALWAALRGEAPADNPPRQSSERSMHTMPDEDSPSGNWAASRWSGEPSSMRDERSEGTMGCSWAAPSFEWGESSMPADSDLEETMPSDGGPVRQEGSQPAKGNDLYREVAITPEQAEAGCQVTVEGYKGAKLSVTIPAHSPNGKQLRCRGRGYPGFNGGENGDLYVTVQVTTSSDNKANYESIIESLKNHNYEWRQEITILAPEAAMGCMAKIYDGDGKPLEIKIPQNCQDGKVLRIKGRGFSNLFGGEKGDLVVTVHVISAPTIESNISLSWSTAARGGTETVVYTEKEKLGTVEREVKTSYKIPVPAGVVIGEKLFYPNVKSEDGSTTSNILVTVGITNPLEFIIIILGIIGFFVSITLAGFIVGPVCDLAAVFIITKILEAIDKARFGPKTPEEKARCQTPRDMSAYM